MIFESSAFFLILGVHFLAGLVCGVTGIMSMVSEKRAGLHPRCGTIYHWGLAVLVTSAGFFGGGALDGRPSALSRGGRFLRCVMLGTHGPKTKLADLGRHTHHFYRGSFIAMLTAFCVEERESLYGLNRLPRLTYWFLPALVGAPLIVRTLVRYRLRYKSDYVTAKNAVTGQSSKFVL